MIVSIPDLCRLYYFYKQFTYCKIIFSMITKKLKMIFHEDLFFYALSYFGVSLFNMIVLHLFSLKILLLGFESRRKQSTQMIFFNISFKQFNLSAINTNKSATWHFSYSTINLYTSFYHCTLQFFQRVCPLLAKNEAVNSVC